MKNTATRLAIVIGLAMLVHLGYLYVRGRGMPTEFRPLKRDLTEMPVRLGTWESEPVETNPRFEDILVANSVVDRRYKDPEGRTIILHANAVMQYFLTLRHHPTHCYTTHGARLIDQKHVELELPDGSSLPVDLLTLETEGQRILVLYWYQFGDKIIQDAAGQRRARWELYGQRTWPALIKVLLQTSALDMEAAQQRLSDFATLVYAWTKDINTDPDADRPAT